MLGLDISSTSVKLLAFSRPGQVEAFGTEPLPAQAVVEKSIKDADQVGDAIARLVARSSTKVRDAAVAVAGSAVITRTLEMPSGLTEDEMEDLLQVEAGQHIPYPVDEVAMDFAVQGPTAEDKVEVLIAACRREHVELREAVLERAGLVPWVVDIEAHCMQRACNLLEAQPASAEMPEIAHIAHIAVVDIGATMTTLTVLKESVAKESAAKESVAKETVSRKRQVAYVREHLFGSRHFAETVNRCYGISLAEIELARGRQQLPEDYESVVEPFRQTVVQEVMRALQVFYSSDNCQQVDQIILAGGTASLDSLACRVETALGINCQVANPFAGMKPGSGVDEDELNASAPALMIACGLAQRSFN